MFLYRDRAHFEGDAFGWEIRRKHGYVWEELEGEALRAVDPAFSPSIGFAAACGDHGMIADPGRYVKDLAAHFEAQGGRVVIATVEDIAREGGRTVGVQVSRDGAGVETLPCDAAVVALGAWSGPLAEKLGVRVPLESERGYHVELWDPTIAPRNPVMVAAGKFVATPMDGRLRLAGIVEFGGLDAPPSKAPFETV